MGSYLADRRTETFAVNNVRKTRNSNVIENSACAKTKAINIKRLGKMLCKMLSAKLKYTNKSFFP